MTEFTKGPWRVSSAKPTKTRGVDILAGYAETIASVPVKAEYFSDRNHMANASVIAAAPSMYAVLAEIGDSPNLTLNQSDAISKALALARGESA